MTNSHDDLEHHGDASVKADAASIEKNTFYRTVNGLTKIFDGPATLFRGIIEKTRKDQPYYHRVYKRVPTVDECPYQDHVCIFEANEQFLRDRKVDKFICQILLDRSKECYQQWGMYDGAEKCKKIDEDSELAHTNYFIKYGELAATANCVDAYMKQKHRLIWQRRNPDKDIVGFEKRKEKLDKLYQYNKEAGNNPHQST